MGVGIEAGPEAWMLDQTVTYGVASNVKKCLESIAVLGHDLLIVTALPEVSANCLEPVDALGNLSVNRLLKPPEVSFWSLSEQMYVIAEHGVGVEQDGEVLLVSCNYTADNLV